MIRRRLLVVDLNAGLRPQQEPYHLLAHAGFEVLLLIPQSWKEPFGSISAECSGAPGLTIKALPVFFNGKYHRVLFSGLAREVAAFQPDELWVHAEPENFLAYQALRARDRHAAGARLSCVSWRNIDYPRDGLPYKAAGLHQKIEDALLRSGVRVLCYNADALAVMKLRGFEVAPIRMGVNLDYFGPGDRGSARKKLGLPETGAIAGFAGRFIPEKGVSDLIEAAARIKGLRLLLVGDGPAKGDWLARASALGVELTTLRLKHDQMADAFRAMDLLCLPSHSTPAWKEQFGRVLVEAMACGTPVLGSDSGAIPEVINAGGRVFPEGDIAGLTAGLKQLLKAPPRKAALKRAGEFAWKAVAKDLIRDFGPAQKNRFKTVSVQGVAVFGGDRSEAIAAFEGMLRAGQGGLVFYLNAHTAGLAAKDPVFKNSLRKADLVLPDGAAILWAAKWKGKRIPERLALGDLLAPLAQRASAARAKIFLWGGEKGVAEQASAQLGVKIDGCAHGYQNEAECSRLIATLRARKIEVIFLGLGSPKQEALALRLRQELPGALVVVCGNAFVFAAGLQKRAPAWMQAASLEWLWRLMLEPGRLWRRYLLGNIRFMLSAAWECLGGRP